ncbi:hypothetical protein [Flavobacterium laiguense]|uniref:Lipoprotein n=1 Tax=Flavobacterium laiguense TaxID=2169409 RepID=A0A2U1JY96_9FLAO|nr:hypothetical protein [Flavobacterium laiguense]PWA10190.1 hypothetical protein DB891_05700 [Flavobacterium laiguense]
MKDLKTIFSFLFLASLISCGGKNEAEEKNKKETSLSETSKVISDSMNTELSNDTSTVKFTHGNFNTSSSSASNTKDSGKNNMDKRNSETSISSPTKEAETVINSPLRNLLKQAQTGKSYTKKELIEEYKFPKEAVDLIKQVTCVGSNKLYFKWGNTWIAEKVSDAEFENDTLIFTFKQNKTYVSGGAIGIKYNKKLYTDLILNNGAAYIPTVKGYHWDINK